MLQVVARHARDEPLVVVLDEFTYLLGAHPPLASVHQRLWDSGLRHTQLKLVLCGSHIGMIESEVLGYQAPLYGRRTAQYLLDPLAFADTTSLFPYLDAAAAYGPPNSIRNTSNCPKTSAAKTTERPSGDGLGHVSKAGWSVILVRWPPSTSIR